MRGGTPYVTFAVGDAQEGGTRAEVNLACVLAANRRWNGTSHCTWVERLASAAIRKPSLWRKHTS